MKCSTCSLSSSLKGSGFKGSEVDFPVTLTNEIYGKGKQRKAIIPELGTRNLLTQPDRIPNLWAISRSIKLYGHLYLMNKEVCSKGILRSTQTPSTIILNLSANGTLGRNLPNRQDILHPEYFHHSVF